MVSMYSLLPALMRSNLRGAEAIKYVIDQFESENLQQDAEGRYVMPNGGFGGFVVNETGRCGWTLAALAAQNNDVELFHWIVGQGADINARAQGYSSLMHAAATGGSVEIIQYLYDQGLDLDQAAIWAGDGSHGDTMGHYTPLHRAIRYGKVEAADLLIRLGAGRSIANPPADTPNADALVYTQNLLAALNTPENSRDQNKYFGVWDPDGPFGDRRWRKRELVPTREALETIASILDQTMNEEVSFDFGAFIISRRFNQHPLMERNVVPMTSKLTY